MLNIRLELSGSRNVYATALAQAGGHYNITFLMVALPFIVEEISPQLDTAQRLFWAGLLVGATSLSMVVAAMVWGRMAEKYNPKILLARAFMIQAITTTLIALTDNLYAIFALRCIQGLFGEAATVALIIVSSSSKPEKRASNISLFQSVNILTMFFAPALGALAYNTFGYRIALLLGAGLAVLSTLLVLFVVSNVPRPRSKLDENGQLNWGWFAVASIFIAFASAQHVGVTPLLPTIFQGFGVSKVSAVNYVGLMASLSAIGSFAALTGIGRVADRIGDAKPVVTVSILSAVSLVLMGLTGSAETFVLLRIIQVSMISAIFAPVMARASALQRWKQVGRIQAARYLGAGVGSLGMATLVTSFGLSLAFAMIAVSTSLLAVSYAVKSRAVPFEK